MSTEGARDFHWDESGNSKLPTETALVSDGGGGGARDFHWEESDNVELPKGTAGVSDAGGTRDFRLDKSDNEELQTGAESPLRSENETSCHNNVNYIGIDAHCFSLLHTGWQSNELTQMAPLVTKLLIYQS